jgi:hypothetical protein
MKRMTKLQWEYDRALKNGEGDIKGKVSEMLNEYAI